MLNYMFSVTFNGWHLTHLPAIQLLEIVRHLADIAADYLCTAERIHDCKQTQ